MWPLSRLSVSKELPTPHSAPLFHSSSIGVASLILFTQKNYKRMLAYSSIENMGIMAFGFGIGGLGIYAALLHMVYHSLLKSALFLTAGNVFLRYSTTKIAKVKGLVFSLPVTSILFLTGVFLTKLFILTAGIQTHPASTIAAIFLIALLFVGLLKQVIAMTFGEKPEEIETGEKENMLILAPLALIAIALYLSFHVPAFLKTLLIEAASHY
jgi:hydrogenase-4 component F